MSDRKRHVAFVAGLAVIAGSIVATPAGLTGYLGSGLATPPICSTSSSGGPDTSSDPSAPSVASLTSINLNPTGAYVKAAATSDSSLNLSYFDQYPEFKGLSKADRESRKANLAKVDGVAIARGLNTRERALNLGVVLQESRGYNNPGGHLDSQGLYQQRAGWGTSSQRMNPEYAANAFIDALLESTTKKQRATLPLVELGILVQVPNKPIYRNTWKWDKLVSAMVGTTPPSGDTAGELLDDEVTLGGDSGSDGCIPASCYFGSYSPVDSLRIATWNREYGNSGSKFRQGLLTLAKGADIIALQELGDGSWNVATSFFAKQGFGTVKREYRNAVPIYYNKSKFTYLDSGEERPSRGSRVESGAGGRSFGNKNVTWLKLRVKSTGAVVIMINQHIVPSYESGGRLDRDKPLRIALYKKQMSALNDLVTDFRKEGLVYASADWNFDAEKDEKIESKDGVRALLEKMGLSMNWRTLGFGKFTGTHASDRFIDGIAGFVTKAAVPVTQAVLSSFGSDHKAVIVTYKGEATKDPSSSSGVAYGDPVSQQVPNSKTKAAPAPTPTPTPSPSNPQTQAPEDETPEDPACSGQSEGGNKLSGQCLTSKVKVRGEASIGVLKPDARLMVQCAKGFFSDYKFSYTTYNGGVDQSHPSGQAVDIMRNNATLAEGWKLANWLREHKSELGIWLLIYDGKIWNVERDKEGWRNYTGTSNMHTDHIHAQTWGNKAKGMGEGSTADTSGWGSPLKKKYAVTSPFGMRTHPKTGIYKLHDGSDYGVGIGTPIVAPADGTVKSRGYNAYIGNNVALSHAGGKVTTTFAHLSTISVQDGESVKRGQIIGYSGNSGEYTTGAHLHTMVQVQGYVNPECANRPLKICNGAKNWVDAHEFYTSSSYRGQFVKYAPLLGKQDVGLAA